MSNDNGTETVGIDAGAGKKKVKGTVAKNPRSNAIAKISNLLDALDEESRGTVVEFIANEYKEFIS